MAEFVERLTSVTARREGVATNGVDVAVVLSFALGEDVELEAGAELTLALDTESAIRLAESIASSAVEAEACRSAGVN